MNRISTFLFLTLALTLSGCGKDVLTPFGGVPDQPLVDGASGRQQSPDGDFPTDYCKKNADGQYPDAMYKLDGDGRSDLLRAVGGGCINRNIKDVWATALNQPLMVWNEVDESSAVRQPAPEGVTHFYETSYAVFKFITVRWKMKWFYSLQEGTLERPERVLVNYTKTEGTSFIKTWRGNFLLERVNDNVTAFYMANEIEARQNDLNDTKNAINDVYGKLRTGAPDFTQFP